MPQLFQAKIKEIEDMSPRVKCFTLELNKPITFKPGQFGTWMFKVNEENLQRPYSFSNQKYDEVTEVQFLILLEKNGKVTPQIFSMNKGDEVKIIGPGGHMTLPDNLKNFKEIIFLATGTGVGPFIPMISQALESSKKTKLIFGAYNEEEILDKKYFEELSEKNNLFSYTPVLSEPNSSWEGEKGFVQEQLEKKDYSSSLFIICGNPLMLKSALKTLEEFSVPKENIIYEEWQNR